MYLNIAFANSHIQATFSYQTVKQDLIMADLGTSGKSHEAVQGGIVGTDLWPLLLDCYNVEKFFKIIAEN